ncbi:hypothetical protein [Glycomyces buryatensis]|uniref:Uncharacterized protein n=1 Tax=Glycomyces buryatensis TaxID=2570927 RepID=A0A4V4HS92_9ACTN|nr:hypothetical protein [Glycomyces buryatensis]THV40876.1 hypothetical protein FAB82_13560 [Glycomyces buryatensis]
MITKDSESPKLPADRLGPGRAYALASSALAVAAARRFPDGSTYGEIVAYSKGLADRFPGGSELLKPAIVEAMLRTGRGEEGLLDGLDMALVQQLLLMLPHALLAEQELGDAEKQEFINEVLTLTDEGA